MPLIQNPTYAPVVVTSVKIVHGAGTNELVSEPPPGWAERHLALRRSLSEERRDSEECELALTRNVSEEREDWEGCGSLSPDLRDNSQSSKHPCLPILAKSEPKVRILSSSDQTRLMGDAFFRTTSFPSAKYTIPNSRNSGSSVTVNPYNRRLPRQMQASVLGRRSSSTSRPRVKGRFGYGALTGGRGMLYPSNTLWIWTSEGN